MAAFDSYWLRHFRLLLCNHCTEFNEIWQEASTHHPLPSLCFLGRSGHPGLWFTETFLTSLQQLDWYQRNLTGGRHKNLNYRITGIFCGCLIFAVFCGSVESAEIKNRKIFQSRYNDEFVSEVIVQSRVFRCLHVRYGCGIICIMQYTPGYKTVMFLV